MPNNWCRAVPKTCQPPLIPPDFGVFKIPDNDFFAFKPPRNTENSGINSGQRTIIFDHGEDIVEHIE